MEGEPDTVDFPFNPLNDPFTWLFIILLFGIPLVAILYEILDQIRDETEEKDPEEEKESEER